MRPRRGVDLTPRLGEAEDVVDKEERVGTGRVTEIFGHRQRGKGHTETGSRRLVHLAEDHACLLDDAAAGVADLCFLHLQPQVGPLAGPLADTGKHRGATVGTGDTGDGSVRMTVLPRPAPPKRPALPPRTNGVRRSMTLMPVSNSSVFVERSVIGGGSRWIGQRSFVLTGPRLSIGSPARLKTRPRVSLPTGTERGAPGIDAGAAADHAVGAAEGDAAHLAATEMLLDFPDEVDGHPLRLMVDLDGVVDRRDRVLGELRVKRRPDNLGDMTDFAAVLLCCRCHAS